MRTTIRSSHYSQMLPSRILYRRKSSFLLTSASLLLLSAPILAQDPKTSNGSVPELVNQKTVKTVKTDNSTQDPRSASCSVKSGGPSMATRSVKPTLYRNNEYHEKISEENAPDNEQHQLTLDTPAQQQSLMEDAPPLKDELQHGEPVSLKPELEEPASLGSRVEPHCTLNEGTSTATATPK